MYNRLIICIIQGDQSCAGRPDGRQEEKLLTLQLIACLSRACGRSDWLRMFTNKNNLNLNPFNTRLLSYFISSLGKKLFKYLHIRELYTVLLYYKNLILGPGELYNVLYCIINILISGPVELYNVFLFFLIYLHLMSFHKSGKVF